MPLLLEPELEPEPLPLELELLPLDPELPPSFAYSGVAAIPSVNKAMVQTKVFLNFIMMIPLKVNEVTSLVSHQRKPMAFVKCTPHIRVIISHVQLNYMREFIPRQLFV